MHGKNSAVDGQGREREEKGVQKRGGRIGRILREKEGQKGQGERRDKRRNAEKYIEKKGGGESRIGGRGTREWGSGRQSG